MTDLERTEYGYPDVSADFVAPVPDEEDEEWGDPDDYKIPNDNTFECAVCGKDKAFEKLAVKVCAGEFICLDCHCQAIDYSVKEAYA